MTIVPFLKCPLGRLDSRGKNTAFTLNTFRFLSRFLCEDVVSFVANSLVLEINLISDNHFVSEMMCAYKGKTLIFLSGFEMTDSERKCKGGPVLSGEADTQPGWWVTHL